MYIYVYIWQAPFNSYQQQNTAAPEGNTLVAVGDEQSHAPPELRLWSPTSGAPPPEPHLRNPTCGAPPAEPHFWSPTSTAPPFDPPLWLTASN